MHYIYGLFDPRDGQLRYIGQTVNIVERFKAHCNTGAAGILKSSWVEELQKLGLRPEIRELETATDSNVQEVEEFYISYFRMLGANLTNNNGVRVTRHKPRKAKVQMMMRIDGELLAQIDERAAQEGISRSAWISQTCSRKLKK